MPREASPALGPVRLVVAGPACVAPGTATRFARADGVGDGVADGAAPDRLVVTNPIALAATFDGQHVVTTPDADQLAAFAQAVRDTWRDVARTHEGALLYLSKYITPHPPGEPHFFVKPSALVATPPGVSTLIDGIPGAGYDILRGVVRTDGFHATPAVFQLWQPDQTIRVARGARLAELFPCPRPLAEAPLVRSKAGIA